MDRSEIVQIQNDLLKSQGDLRLWNKCFVEYLEAIGKEKESKTILDKLQKLPTNFQVAALKVSLEYFGKKLNICYLYKEEVNSNFMINGNPVSNRNIYYYF